MQADPAKIRAAFDALAESWDASHGPASPNGSHYAARLASLRAICEGLRHPRVLDVGCATGLYLFGLADLISAGLGIDFSPRMIARARATATSRDPERRLHFAVAEAEELSVEAIGRFDLVLIIGTLEHLLLPESALAAAHRVLAPHGEVVVIMRHPWHPATLARRLCGGSKRIPPHQHLTPRELGKLAQGSGLVWERRPLWPRLTYAARLAIG